MAIWQIKAIAVKTIGRNSEMESTLPKNDKDEYKNTNPDPSLASKLVSKIFYLFHFASKS
jgi:hypothetical protein